MPFAADMDAAKSAVAAEDLNLALSKFRAAKASAPAEGVRGMPTFLNFLADAAGATNAREPMSSRLDK